MIHLVTSAPPTPNGGLHLGHASGPYLAGDIFTRIRRLLGDKVVYVSYSDEYQDYLVKKSIDINDDLQNIQNLNYSKIVNDFNALNISYDNFSRSYNKENHKKNVNLNVNLLTPYLITKNDQVPYCVNCSHWGYEAFARGNCDNCGCSSDRSQCENCAYPPEVTGLNNIKCNICGEDTISKSLERSYICFDKFINDFGNVYSNINVRNQLKNYINNILNIDSLDWPIDRDNNLGYPYKDKKISTWFSGLAGYITSLNEINPDIEIDSIENITFFVGFDCSFSHAFVYPTILKLLGFNLNNLSIYTNNFLKLNNKDFSTSRGHAIWVNDFVNIKNSDYVRFYLSLYSPEDEHSNFDLEDYMAFESKLNKIIDKIDFSKTCQLEEYISFTKKHDEIFNHREFSMRNYANFVYTVILEIKDNEDYLQYLHYLLKPLMPNLCK